MAQITISGTAYDEDALPDAAKGALRGLQAVDGRIEGIHTEISILKAKPQAYGADKRMAYLLEELGILETARGAYPKYIWRGIPDQIHLTAITPDGGTTARDFGTDVKAATAWAVEENTNGRNIHWTVNHVQSGVHRKPSKADIIYARFAHGDIDPSKDGSPWDAESVLKGLLDSPVPPSIIVNSGNGLQALWELEGSQSAQDVETVNVGLIQAFDGDRGTQNVDLGVRL